MHARTCTHARARAHTHTHNYTHSFTHTRTREPAHERTHTHSQNRHPTLHAPPSLRAPLHPLTRPVGRSFDEAAAADNFPWEGDSGPPRPPLPSGLDPAVGAAADAGDGGGGGGARRLGDRMTFLVR